MRNCDEFLAGSRVCGYGFGAWRGCEVRIFLGFAVLGEAQGDSDCYWSL